MLADVGCVPFVLFCSNVVLPDMWLQYSFHMYVILDGSVWFWWRFCNFCVVHNRMREILYCVVHNPIVVLLHRKNMCSCLAAVCYS